MFGREPRRQVGGGPDIDSMQQLLHVGPHDPLGRELLGHYLSVEQCDRKELKAASDRPAPSRREAEGDPHAAVFGRC
jgi:hypothetical protein